MAQGRHDHSQGFPSTWWTLIEQALRDDSTERTEALDQLVRRYAGPLRAHLVLRKRLNPEAAEELVQAFIVEKIVAQYVLRHADRAKGRFRALLVRSLDNFCTDRGRVAAAQAATGRMEAVEEAAACSSTHADIFDVAWARQILHEVLATMKADCLEADQVEIWGVFENRLLAPAYEGVEPLSYEEVCRRFNFSSPQQASNALMTAKRKFQRAFAQVAGSYQHDGEQADDVLREVIEIFSQARPLDWQQVSASATPKADAPHASPAELDNSRPGQLARMLQRLPDVDGLWPAEDLRGLIQHQLAQRLVDLNLGIPAAHLEGARSPQGTVIPLETLDDLYRHPAPPLELLEAVKRFSRKLVHQPTATLPDEIASALYFASIAAALVVHDQRISSSDDDLLRWGIERLLSRTWIEEPLRSLFDNAIARLGSRDKPV